MQMPPIVTYDVIVVPWVGSIVRAKVNQAQALILARKLIAADIQFMRMPDSIVASSEAVSQFTSFVDDLKYDARIEKWHQINDVILGVIYDDQKARFNDGTIIKTSKIVRFSTIEKIVQTENSFYKLGEPA